MKEISLYNFYTCEWDDLEVEDPNTFNFEKYVGCDNQTRNLYNCYILEGYTNLGAAIRTLEEAME